MASSQVNPLKRKHTALTLETKLKLLSEIDNMGKTTMKKDIADNYVIPANALSTNLKNREKTEKMASSSSVNLSKKRMWTSGFFKCLPDKTLDFKRAICTGGKKAKDRPTVLVAANMSVKDMLPLFVIGKTAKPYSFNNVKNLMVD